MKKLRYEAIHAFPAAAWRSGGVEMKLEKIWFIPIREVRT